MEENAKVSTHQLIIHDAFKACAAALRRHGNCTVSCYTMVVYYIWLSFCAESEAHVCSDRGGPPWGNEVLSFAENMAALSYMKGTMHACTVHKCVCAHTINMYRPCSVHCAVSFFPVRALEQEFYYSTNILVLPGVYI